MARQMRRLPIMIRYQKSPDFNIIKASLKQPVIFEGRNLFEPSSVAAPGI